MKALKGKFILKLFVTLIGSFEKTGENYPRKCFLNKRKRNRINYGLSSGIQPSTTGSTIIDPWQKQTPDITDPFYYGLADLLLVPKSQLTAAFRGYPLTVGASSKLDFAHLLLSLSYNLSATSKVAEMPISYIGDKTNWPVMFFHFAFQLHSKISL